MNAELGEKLRALGFVAIVLVIYVHAYQLPAHTTTGGTPAEVLNRLIQNGVSNGLARVAVPLFFAVSGFLFFARAPVDPGPAWFRAQWRKRLRTLLVPYLAWSLIGLILVTALQAAALEFLPAARGFFSQALIFEHSPLELLDRLFLHPVSYQLWFVRDLLVYTLASPALYILTARAPRAGLAILAALWFADVDLKAVSTEGLLFFVSGATLAVHGPPPAACRFGRAHGGHFMALWAGLVIAYALSCIWQEVGWFWQEAGSAWLRKLSVLAGLAALWFGYGRYARRAGPVLAALGSLTFFVFAAHEPLLAVVRKALVALAGPDPAASLGVYLLAPTLVLGATLGAGAWLRARAPRAYGLLTGGR